jgi:hypothetical protein
VDFAKNLNLEVLPNTLAVCRLSSNDSIPSWAFSGDFFSISKTADELSIVCEEKQVPAGVKAGRGWRCLKVKGPLDFGLTGILASLAKPLAEAGISIFAVSTFDTDYLLVKMDVLERAISVLSKAGHTVAQ